MNDVKTFVYALMVILSMGSFFLLGYVTAKHKYETIEPIEITARHINEITKVKSFCSSWVQESAGIYIHSRYICI